MARRSTTAAQAVSLSELAKPEEEMIEAIQTQQVEEVAQIQGGAYGVQTPGNIVAQPNEQPDMELVPSVKRYMVTNHDGVNVMLNGAMCRLRYGKEVDSQNYDISRLEMMGVVLKEIGA